MTKRCIFSLYTFAVIVCIPSYIACCHEILYSEQETFPARATSILLQCSMLQLALTVVKIQANYSFNESHSSHDKEKDEVFHFVLCKGISLNLLQLYI